MQVGSIEEEGFMGLGSGKWAGGRVGAVTVAVAVAIAVAASGCGGESGAGDAAAERADGPKAEIRAAYDEYVKSLYAADGAGACEAMTRGVRRELGASRPCEQSIADNVKYLLLLEQRPRIVGLVKDGAEYRARITTGIGKGSLLWFAEEDGAWKIAAGMHGRETDRRSGNDRQ